MKRILIFYYTKEINNQSHASVPRLIASLIGFFEEKYHVTFFTFNPAFEDLQIKTRPVYLSVSTIQRALRNINNRIGLKRITYFKLKQSCVRTYITRAGLNFDFVITLRLDDVMFLRKMNPHIRLLYWIHDVSTAHASNLLAINYADDVLSPSVTTYREIVKQMQPRAFVSAFTFLPNWCAPYFKKLSEDACWHTRSTYKIESHNFVFAFAGGDVTLKGGHLIKKVFKNFKTISYTQNIVLFYIGGANKNDTSLANGIRIIETGVMNAEEIAACYNIAQFGLMPSLGYDHAPLTLLEMISCGVLPIASDIGGIKEMLGDGYSLLVDVPNATNEWGNKIQTALQLTQGEYCSMLQQLEHRVTHTYNRHNSFSIFNKLLIE